MLFALIRSNFYGYVQNAHMLFTKYTFTFKRKKKDLQDKYLLGKVIGEYVLRDGSYDLPTINTLHKRECVNQKTYFTQIYLTNT